MTTGRIAPRLREAGDSSYLLELEAVIDPAVNARVIAIARAVRTAAIAGVRDVVAAYRSVAIFFEPLITPEVALKAAISDACEASPPVAAGAAIEIPVHYGGEDGPDLAAVAHWAGVTPDEVVRRHVAEPYRVFMLGFLPGFAYMGRVDPSIAAPRHPTPRLRVPAGAVGIAGQQTGIYPIQSPGGWQLIGRTATHVFDPARNPSALFAPGDSVRFVRARGSSQTASSAPSEMIPVRSADRTVTVLSPGLFTTVQDMGRWGHQSSGVPIAGAMDTVAHRRANALVGNPISAATLETTVAGPELRFDADTVVGIAGADLGASIEGDSVPVNTARHCRAGSVLRFDGRRRGARAYIACDGGVDVPLAFGSRSTHVLSGSGGVAGRAIRSGDRIALRSVSGSVSGRYPDPYPDPDLSLPNGGARVRVLPGPQDYLFEPAAIEVLRQSRYVLTPESNRMGYRLTGRTIPSPPGEMISDVTFPGAIQVPPSGQPILLMADRQTIGGYPQIATVITADLPLAGQLAPGDWIEFAVCTRHEAIAALRDLERALGSDV